MFTKEFINRYGRLSIFQLREFIIEDYKAFREAQSPEDVKTLDSIVDEVLKKYTPEEKDAFEAHYYDGIDYADFFKDYEPHERKSKIKGMEDSELPMFREIVDKVREAMA